MVGEEARPDLAETESDALEEPREFRQSFNLGKACDRQGEPDGESETGGRQGVDLLE